MRTGGPRYGDGTPYNHLSSRRLRVHLSYKFVASRIVATYTIVTVSRLFEWAARGLGPIEGLIMEYLALIG
jgi:hypothetical protein